jgi:hypothetical protein
MRQALSRSFIRSLVSVLIFTLFAAFPASVQLGYAQADPPADSFTFVDAEGADRAVITVIEVQDPFDEFAEASGPGEGAKFVIVTVSYEDTGPGPFETRPDQIVVQDADGYIWTSTGIQRPDGFEIPDLQYVQIAPGDRLSGMVGFQVPNDAEIVSVHLRPENSRLLVLAPVGADPQAGPEAGAEISYQMPESGAEGIVSVSEILDPFDDYPEGQDAQDGARYVSLTITIENIGSVPLSVHPNTLLLQDSDGYLWSYASVPRGSDVVVPDLQAQELAPGSRISGVVGFQIPDDAAVSNILLQPENGRIIALAQPDSGGSDDGATPEPKLGTVERS